jgi:hypothetical protein
MNHFEQRYASLSDDELLMIAADRMDLTDEATLALDAEMQRRGLSDEQARQKKGEVERLTEEEAKAHLREAKDTKYFVGKPKIYWAILIAVLVATAYLILVPRQLRIPKEWEEPAAAALTGACMAPFIVRSWVRQKLSFWIALAVSSATQVLLCDWLFQHYPLHSRGEDKGIWFASLGAGYLLGGALFLLVQRLTPQEEPEERLW